MKRNRRRGATLALVAALSFVLVMIGFAVFYLAKLVGGGRQLQQATDSGNLNVAKQALTSPTLRVFSTNGYSGPYDISNAQTLQAVQQNFSTLADPINGQLDLLSYNRLVAQTLLVAMNAAADGSAQGKADAQYVISLLNDPTTGLGTLLAKKLQNDSALDTNFTNLASMANLPMLQVGDVDNDVSAQKDASYMLAPTQQQTNISNVYLSPNTIPPQFLASFEQNQAQSRYGNYYLNGYQFLDVNGVTDHANFGLMGVPLRPRQQPHLVAETEFDSGKTSPFKLGGISTVPPNAFKSGSTALSASANQLVNAVSCAIAGSIAQTGGEFGGSLPGGYFVFVNGDGPAPQTAPPGAAITLASNAQYYTGTTPGQPSVDIFSILMQGVYVSGNQNPNQSGLYPSAVASYPDCINNIEKAMWATVAQRVNAGQAAYQGPQGYLAAGDSSVWACLTAQSDAERAQDAASLSPPEMPTIGSNPNQPPFAGDAIPCNNMSVSPPEPGDNSASNPICVNALAHSVFQNAYGATTTPNGSGGGNQPHLSAIEYLKDQVIEARGGQSPPQGPGSGSGTGFYIQPFNVCTGMNAINLIGFTSPPQTAKDTIAQPTINNLLSNNGGYYGFGNVANNGSTAQTTSISQKSQSIIAAITRKVYQIYPQAQQSDLDTIFNTQLPLGSVMYAWFNTSSNQFQVTTAANLPARINPNDVFADGTTLSINSNGISPMIQGTDTPSPQHASFLDSEGDGGYEHPYDCVSNNNATTFNEADWYPNSGAGNIQGVLRFKNCVNTGPSNIAFDCPC